MTSNAPRMNGWIRQKYEYFPTGRDTTMLYTGTVSDWPPCTKDGKSAPSLKSPPSMGSTLPSLPVSNEPAPPSGTGKFDTYVPRHGHAHDVKVWRTLIAASSLMNCSVVP